MEFTASTVNTTSRTPLTEFDDFLLDLQNIRKKKFGHKIKVCQWEKKNLVTPKEAEVDIINYLNKHKNFSIEDLKSTFNISPSPKEVELLNKIIEKII